MLVGGEVGRVDGRSVVKNWGAIWRIMALKLHGRRRPRQRADSPDHRLSGTDHTDRRCCATTGVFASARARRISTTPTTRNQISGGKFAMMAGPQPPGL